MNDEKTSPNTTDERIHEILTNISKALDVPIEYLAEGPDNKVVPYFDISGINSKLAALMVFVGIVTQPITPPYNRVHADVEYWKKKFEAA